MTEQEELDRLLAAEQRWGYPSGTLYAPVHPYLLDLLDRIADSLERLVEIDGRASALSAWQMGQGRHPDD